MENVYLAGAVRTPIGRYGGALAGLTPAELGAIVAAESLSRAGLGPNDVQEVGYDTVRAVDTTEYSATVDFRRAIERSDANTAVRAEVQAALDLLGNLDMPVKVWIDAQGGRYPKLTPEFTDAVMDQAKKHNKIRMAHIVELADARRIVDQGVNILAHNVRDQEIPDDFIAILKDKNVSVISTLAREEGQRRRKLTGSSAGCRRRTPRPCRARPRR